MATMNTAAGAGRYRAVEKYKKSQGVVQQL
jgi:hypothetical protein